MNTHRLRRRWNTVARYVRTAHRWRDRWPLALAGLARQRPFGGTSLYATIGRLLAKEVAPRVAAANGQRVWLDLRDFVDLMIFEEIFIDGIYPLERVPFVPDAIVDCGACAGFFTLLAHGRFPGAACHLFEPNPINLVSLRRNLTTNSIQARVHAAAVGEKSGVVKFTGRGFGGHIADAGDAHAIEVPLESLPHYLAQIHATRLLLKIDIEGAEATLLPALAANLPQKTALFLETHHEEAVWRHYLQPLITLGFSHTLIRERHDEQHFVEHFLVRD